MGLSAAMSCSHRPHRAVIKYPFWSASTALVRKQRRPRRVGLSRALKWPMSSPAGAKAKLLPQQQDRATPCHDGQNNSSTLKCCRCARAMKCSKSGGCKFWLQFRYGPEVQVLRLWRM